MNLDILTLLTNRIYQTESYHLDLLKILVSLRGTEYEEYIRYLIPSDLKVLYSDYNDLDCVNDIMMLVLEKGQNKQQDLTLQSVVETIHLDVLENLMDRNLIKIRRECVYKAIRIGRLDILKFLHRKDMLIGHDDLFLCNAAENPDPSVFQWIYDRMNRVRQRMARCHCISEAYIFAAVFHGNLEVIKCIHENKIYIGYRFIRISSKLGHDKMTEWLRQNISE